MPRKRHHQRTVETLMVARERAAMECDARRPRPLVSRPQHLGILPSCWFWNELWRTDPRLSQFFAVLCWLLSAPFIYICIVYLPPTWLSVGLIGVSSVLSMGLAERWLRRMVARRRRQLAARSHDLRGELPAEPDGEIVDDRHCDGAGDQQRTAAGLAPGLDRRRL